ncbi:MAG: YfbM family protein [Fimbriiglobus sp.]|nr:YfbM family protein [Fimbriiglobus sp.]
MPIFFQTPLEHTKATAVAATAVGGLLVFARRGPKNRLLLSAQSKIHPQGFGLFDEYTSEERSDTEPALGTLFGHAYLAWKGDGNDLLNIARVVLEGNKVVGLADKETFEQEGVGPLSLVPQSDRFLLGHTTPGGLFAYASVVPFDPTFTDPLPPGVVGCELCAVTDEDEFYLVGSGDSWDTVGRMNHRDRIRLGEGWLTLLHVLKEGKIDVYHGGDPSEWEGMLGHQTYWNQLINPSEEEMEGAEEFLHYLAISHAEDVGQYAEALGKITPKKLLDRYNKLSMPAGKRRSGREYEAAWEVLQQLVPFLKATAEKGLWCVHRTRLPAARDEPLPDVGKVKVKTPTARQATAVHPQGLGILARAADSFGVQPNAPANEWPFNVLSQKAVRYGSGRIAREGDDPQHDYDPAELERCSAVAIEAAARFARLPVRSVYLGPLEAFTLPANRGGKAPADLTPEFIRAAFRGTLHPWAQVEIESAREWGVESIDPNEASIHGYRSADMKTHRAIWRETTDWFQKHPELTKRAWYVQIQGGGLHDCQAIRLIVGLTKGGSLAGVATVAIGSGHTFTIPPEKLHRELRKYELQEYPRARDPATGRVIANMVLRTFHANAIVSWAERTEAAARKMKQKDRPAYWREQFGHLVPDRTLTLGPVWEAVQRCLAAGRFSGYPASEEPVFFGSYHSLGETAEQLGYRLLGDDGPLKTSNWLDRHSSDWLAQRYDDLRATDYAPYMSAADKQAVLDAYAALREFYQYAKNGLAVVTHIQTHAEPESKPTAAKKGKAKGKSKPAGGCEATAEMLAPLLQAMESYTDNGTEWAFNDLSTKTERYTCGNIAREGKTIPHDHDPAELERCRALAAEAERLLSPIDPPHDSGGPYLAFFSTANKGEPVPEAFTEEFVRKRLFRGAINPECGISIEPLTARAVWYDEGSATATGFVDWLRAQPGLHGFAFVSIGLSEDEGGSTHPRLALALTDQGSVVGVCGYVIWA